ncbi:MAG: hypothetical protein HY870_06740 [Chloroflexi bacterium]|nr:hypothetical protein [Chloroflexota bacterium]
MKWLLISIVLWGLTACSPTEQAEADNARLLAQPTATAAAIRNQEAQTHADIVVPAQAQAEAKSIVARTDQQIAEDAHQQALRHQGEVAALTLSNTQQLNEINARFVASVTGIKANGEEAVANAEAAMEERTAEARIATGLSIGAIIFVLVVAVGGAFAVNKALDNRAQVRVLADDGRNQTIAIGTKIIHRTQQQIGPYVVYDGPTLLERLIATVTASIISIRQRNFEVFTQWHVVGRTSAQTTEAAPADLIKLDNNGVAGWIAGQAVKATPQAAQQITASVVQRTSSVFQPDEPPELILLNDPAQRRYLEAALERAR